MFVRRAGFLVVFLIAGLAADLAGAGKLGAIAAGAAAGVAWAVGVEPRLVGSSRRRKAVARFTQLDRWAVAAPPDLDGLVAALRREGLVQTVEEQSPRRVLLSGGSELRTRLLGGYFVDPEVLPIEVEITVEMGDASPIVALAVRDRLGTVAIRDERLGDRFALAARDVRDAVAARV